MKAISKIFHVKYHEYDGDINKVSDFILTHGLSCQSHIINNVIFILDVHGKADFEFPVIGDFYVIHPSKYTHLYSSKEFNKTFSRTFNES